MSVLSFHQKFTVNSLIDTRHKQWNTDVIHQIFSEDQENDIIHTLLVPHIPLDSLIWKAEETSSIW